MTDKKLKPCAHCGNSDITFVTDKNGFHDFACGGCNTYFQTATRNETLALKKWNTRQDTNSDVTREIIEQAYMAGQAHEGIDPSYSQACLLYTSPSPRDGLLSRMPSSA